MLAQDVADAGLEDLELPPVLGAQMCGCAAQEKLLALRLKQAYA